MHQSLKKRTFAKNVTKIDNYVDLCGFNYH